MHRQTARLLIVATLLVTAGLAGVGLEAGMSTTVVPVPAAAALLSGSGWRVLAAHEAQNGGFSYQQWRVANTRGQEAALFVGATRKPQAVYPWSGELGYLGEGYLVQRSDAVVVPVGDRSAQANLVRIKRGAQVLVLAYAALRPDGIVARGGDRPLLLTIDALSRAGPYYLVRVAVDDVGEDSPAIATGLLRVALTKLPASS